MAVETPVLPPPPPIDDSCALFLDVDGTLLDFAPSPDEVSVPGHLRDALHALHRRLDGAVALVSGRSLATLDSLLAPHVMPAAGLHGLERRHGRRGHRAPRAPAALALVRTEAEKVAARHPGAIVEDKGAALALHWRAAPQAASELQAFAIAALPRLPGYRLQPGNDVLELRPAAHKGGRADKGAAILAFLEEPPFAGRRPVFAGDDITDEAGFAAVNAHGGVSVLVGRPRESAAHFGLSGPAEVHAWIGARP
ncbi:MULTISPECIES: trehalose-phosphatase [unclassified Luteimonas]